MIVEDQLTPLVPVVASAVLAAAYKQFTGVSPSQAVHTLLLAQSALETGNWQKIHNFNFGNQKAGTDYPLIVQFRCSEVVDGVEKFFDPPDPTCNFRAYESAAAGAVDYLRVLHSQPHWWQGLHTGDPSAFVDALATAPKYFTANPELYKTALLARMQQFAPLPDGALECRAQHPAAPLQAPRTKTRAAHLPESDCHLALASLPSGFSPRRFGALGGAVSDARPRVSRTAGALSGVVT